MSNHLPSVSSIGLVRGTGIVFLMNVLCSAIYIFAKNDSVWKRCLLILLDTIVFIEILLAQSFHFKGLEGLRRGRENSNVLFDTTLTQN